MKELLMADIERRIWAVLHRNGSGKLEMRGSMAFPEKPEDERTEKKCF